MNDAMTKRELIALLDKAIALVNSLNDQLGCIDNMMEPALQVKAA